MSHEEHHAGDSTYYLIETQLLLKRLCRLSPSCRVRFIQLMK